MNHIIEKRLKKLKDNFQFILNKTTNKKILITGANGYIGSVLSLILHCNASLICLVRSKEKMITRFRDIGGNLNNIIICENLEEIQDEIEIVIHCAAPTQSSFFVENPIETVDIIYTNTKKMLDFSLQYKVKKFIFLSTMEIYADIFGDDVLENNIGRFDIDKIRNSYPLAKQISEFMVYSYSKQYNLNAAIVRLTQTIGPTAQISDSRVYMDFIRSAINDSKITLLTKGDTKREYIDVFDVSMAIIFIVFNQKVFEIYNVTNSNIFISIYELAKIIAEQLNAEISFDLEQDVAKYLPSFSRKLNSKKIQDLGWKPLFNLQEALSDMINYIKEKNE